MRTTSLNCKDYIVLNEGPNRYIPFNIFKDYQLNNIYSISNKDICEAIRFNFNSMVDRSK